jgi:hypothetical protein
MQLATSCGHVFQSTSHRTSLESEATVHTRAIDSSPYTTNTPTTNAKAILEDPIPGARRAIAPPVAAAVATAPVAIVDEGAGGTYELVGSSLEAVLLEGRDERLVGPVWAVAPHTLFE